MKRSNGTLARGDFTMASAAGAVALSGCYSAHNNEWGFLTDGMAATLKAICDQIIPAAIPELP